MYVPTTSLIKKIFLVLRGDESGKQSIRRILRENQEKLNGFLYDQLPSDTAFREQAVKLIEELENRELIYVFIEVVREDENCPNFARNIVEQ